MQVSVINALRNGEFLTRNWERQTRKSPRVSGDNWICMKNARCCPLRNLCEVVKKQNLELIENRTRLPELGPCEPIVNFLSQCRVTSSIVSAPLSSPTSLSISIMIS